MNRTRRYITRHAEWFAFAPVVVFVFVFHYAFHEPWRDEAQAWLIARGESLGTLMAALRFEGHPPLLYWLLDPFAHAARPLPLAFVAAVNTAFLLAGTCALVRALGASRRASIVFTLCSACTYVYVYELGVVARAYGLGLGLALWMMAFLQRALASASRRDLVLAGLTGAASALTSATAAVYVAAAVAVFGVAFLLAQPRKLIRAVWLAPIVIAMLVVDDVTKPLPHRLMQFEHRDLPMRTWDFDWRESRRWLQALFGVSSSDGWWPTKDIPASHFEYAVEGLRALIVVCVVLHGIRFAREWRTAFFVPIASALQIAGIFYVVFYRGLRPDYRHWAFVMVSAQVVLGSLCLVRERHAILLTIARRASLVLLAPWMWNQAHLARSNLAQDIDHPFSITKQFATMLPRGARVLIEREAFGTAISYWRPDLITRSPAHRGRYYTYVRWDAPDSRASMRTLAVDECGKSTNRAVYVFGNVQDITASCASPLYAPYSGTRARTDEYDRGYVVRCNCLAP